MEPESRAQETMSETMDSAILEVLQADLGQPIEYAAELSSDELEAYEEELEDYAEAHAEAEVGLQDLSTG